MIIMYKCNKDKNSKDCLFAIFNHGCGICEFYNKIKSEKIGGKNSIIQKQALLKIDNNKIK